MPSKHQALEQAFDDRAQDMLAPLTTTAEVLVIDDLGAAIAGDIDRDPANEPQTSYALDETSEIELTAEQMDALLEGRWQP